MRLGTLSVLFEISVILCYTKAATSGLREQDWDHYVFAQQYPAGLCAYNSHNCVDSDISNWTIHGLWPTAGKSKNPQCCNNSYKFNVTEVKDLLPRLYHDWTNLKSSSDYDYLWAHEWSKHGTCSPYATEYCFFKAVLDLYNKLNYGRVLLAANIKPSKKELRLKDLLGAFNQILSVTSLKITCMTSKEEGVQYLTQISVCLDKDEMQPINCPSNSSSCRSEEAIIYTV